MHLDSFSFEQCEEATEASHEHKRFLLNVLCGILFCSDNFDALRNSIALTGSFTLNQIDVCIDNTPAYIRHATTVLHAILQHYILDIIDSENKEEY